MLLVDAPAAPASDSIRETARAILSRPDYHLKPPSNDDFALLRSLWNAAKWLFSPFMHLFEKLNSISPILGIVYIVLLLVAVVFLTWHIIHTFRGALRGRQESRHYRSVEGQALKPAELESRAQRAADRQDYISAVRYLFQASLLRLEQTEKRTLRKGATNHEYLRRFQATAAYEPLQRFVDIIDHKWFGQGRCELADFEACRRAYAELLHQRGT